MRFKAEFAKNKHLREACLDEQNKYAEDLQKLELENFYHYEKCMFCESQYIKIHEKETDAHIFRHTICLDCGHKSFMNWGRDTITNL